MENNIFSTCQEINSYLQNGEDNIARERLIQLLDYLEQNKILYPEIVNYFIRQTGLYPYIQPETANWSEQFVYEAFKVDTGDISPITLHREQSHLLKKLLSGQNIAVSAPTSFGKSFVIDAFISLKKPTNVIIIVPTIALTDETRRRLYKKFANEYKIITTTDVELGKKNIFIFPQERAISYIDKVDFFDIMIIDEFYKASKNFDKDRSPSLVKAIVKLGEKSKQKYFLAPNISSIKDNPFTQDMEFMHLDFNTVYLDVKEIYKDIEGDNELKSKHLLKILDKNETSKTLVYAGTYANIERISTIILANIETKENVLLTNFANWLTKNYDYNWALTNMVKRGVGIHNGSLHRSLSQIQIKLFEEEKGLNSIISTSSIIEGVNTSAENVVLWQNKNGRSKLNDFTYRNIIGRGGRMFKHFIGNIYILDAPPPSTQTQLDIPFPEEILGDLDEHKHNRILTKEQIAKILHYKEEMSELLGVDTYQRLKDESVFQSSNAELIRQIAINMAQEPEGWNGLIWLNSSKVDAWDNALYKIINLMPGAWETKYGTFVEFIKVLRNNWLKSIPELLSDLEPHDVSIDEFFKLERNVSYKFTALLKDVNILQREIIKESRYDISRFVAWCSCAFLPPVVYQLEEYGLPRIITKKIHNAGLLNLIENEPTLHKTIDNLKEIGKEKLCDSGMFDDFDKYIISHFYDGITTLAKQ